MAPKAIMALGGATYKPAREACEIQTATFLTSSSRYTECPTANKPEVAFIGRSNVGKSSLINMLVGKRQLAKTSATPGKTQLINHYLINQSYYFVDLPGYGWAQASKKKRQDWLTMTNQYLLHRSNLSCLLVLLDIRLLPQPIDLDFIAWLKQHQISFSIILTKADKLSKYQVARQLQSLEQILAQQQQEPLSTIATSSKDKIGREALLNFIDKVMP